MCFYTKQKEPIIASEDIKGYKVIVKNGSSEFVPYFDMNSSLKFNTVLTNDSKLYVFKDPFTTEWAVTRGVFHIFKNVDPIKICLLYREVRNRCMNHVFVAEAIIPKGTSYFSGWSNAFTGYDETYASTKIIYKNPIQIDEFLNSI